jgi:hypothetical protein
VSACGGRSNNQRWSTSARRPLCLLWPPQAISPNPYEFLTEVYPALIDVCEDNRQTSSTCCPRRGFEGESRKDEKTVDNGATKQLIRTFSFPGSEAGRCRHGRAGPEAPRRRGGLVGLQLPRGGRHVSAPQGWWAKGGSRGGTLGRTHRTAVWSLCRDRACRACRSRFLRRGERARRACHGEPGGRLAASLLGGRTSLGARRYVPRAGRASEPER